MKKNFAKKLSVVLALAMAVSTLAPAASADAAAAPKFKTYRTTVYENGTNDGEYSYTVANIKKGYNVKWSVSGDAKEYISLSKKSTKATKTTVNNKITVDTEGELAAKNAKATVTAKVYNTKGNLVKTVKDSVQIKVSATDIVVKAADGSNFVTAVGVKYDLNRTLTPANSTSKTYWSVDSADASIDKMGVFTATKAGKYTVTATVKNAKTAKTLVTKTVEITVDEFAVTDVKQIASNSFRVSFAADASKVVTKDNFSVASVDGNNVLSVKSVNFSTDGKTADVTLFNNFLDGVDYTVTCGDAKFSFKASVGAVARVAINTATAQKDVKTPISFTLFDAAGMDVTPSINLDTTCLVSVTGSYSAFEGEKASKASITMNTVGDEAEVTVTYTAGAQDVSFTQKITCASPEQVKGNTLFVSSDDINAKSGSAKFYLGLSDKSVLVRENGDDDSVFFCAKDANEDVISYDSYTIESSNEDVMNVTFANTADGVSDSGKYTRIHVYGNKAGNAQINITASKNGVPTYYTIPVSVVSKDKYAVRMDVEVSRPVMSNVVDPDYVGKITPTLYDANGKEVEGTFKYELLTTTPTDKDLLDLQNTDGASATYSASGVYAKTYTIKVSGADNENLNGKWIEKLVNVTVKALPTAADMTDGTGIKVTYQIETNTKSLDQNPGDDDAVDTLTTRLYASYNGLFAGYVRDLGNGIIVGKDGTQGTVKVATPSAINSASVVVRFGNKLFNQDSDLLGEGTQNTESAYTTVPETLEDLGATGEASYRTVIDAPIINYGEVNAAGEAIYEDLAKTGQYTIEYIVDYTDDSVKDGKITQVVTVKNTMKIPTVTVLGRTVADDDLATLAQQLKTNVDMNNNVSDHESIVFVYDAKANPAAADSNYKIFAKYAVVEDNYGTTLWHFWIPVNTTFTLD